LVLACGQSINRRIICTIVTLNLTKHFTLEAFLLKRRPPIPVETPPTKIRPVESFNPNIYRASMGDDMIPNVARNGARLSNNWNSGGQAMFGRTNTIPE